MQQSKHNLVLWPLWSHDYDRLTRQNECFCPSVGLYMKFLFSLANCKQDTHSGVMMKCFLVQRKRALQRNTCTYNLRRLMMYFSAMIATYIAPRITKRKHYSAFLFHINLTIWWSKFYRCKSWKICRPCVQSIVFNVHVTI